VASRRYEEALLTGTYAERCENAAVGVSPPESTGVPPLYTPTDSRLSLPQAVALLHIPI